MFFDLKWVEVDCHGLILWENDATGSRKVFKYLLGLGDYIKKHKTSGVD